MGLDPPSNRRTENATVGCRRLGTWLLRPPSRQRASFSGLLPQYTGGGGQVGWIWRWVPKISHRRPCADLLVACGVCLLKGGMVASHTCHSNMKRSKDSRSLNLPIRAKERTGASTQTAGRSVRRHDWREKGGDRGRPPSSSGPRHRRRRGQESR